MKKKREGGGIKKLKANLIHEMMLVGACRANKGTRKDF